MIKKSLLEGIEYSTQWGLLRFASPQDAFLGRKYTSAEAHRMFGTDQQTAIRGGIKGAVENVGNLWNALKRGDPIAELLAVTRHLFKGNLLLNEGINELWTILGSAASGTKFDNTNAYLGVGDDATAEVATQTGLIAVTNKLYVAMDSGYPTYGTSQLISFRSTFGSSDANWHWQEFTAANGSSDAAKNLNRKVSDQGTKVSGQQWQLTLQITLA
jgi:hypothetical protein